MAPNSILDLLVQLLAGQVNNSPYFVDGLVPSYRYNRHWYYERPDANLFFTAISVFTLQELRPLFLPNEWDLARRFIARATSAFDRFKNKDGLATYNFYGTRPTAHFPHGLVMHRFRHFQLPDDIDDTAMVYLTTVPSEKELHFLTEKLAFHANGTRQAIVNTYLECRELKAYSTWFGKSMPIEFDACALTNMLCAVYTHNLPLDQHATDSLRVLAHLIETNRYRTDPFHCAPNYARSAIIQYHLARLVARHNPELLRPLVPVMVAHLKADLAASTYLPDQLLRAIALLRLGETPRFSWPEQAPADPFEGHSFFIAGLLSAYEHPWLRQWADSPFWHIRWRCEGHNRVLLLEYLALARQSTVTPA